MARLLVRFSLMVGCLLHVAVASAQVFVIVNVDNPLRAMTKQQVSDLYFGRAKAFQSGEFALVFDQMSDVARSEFFQALVNLPLYQVNVYWSRLMFSGRVLPPQKLSNDNAMIEVVRHSTAAIGYVLHVPNDGSVRVVLVLGDD
jgi:hypothetical protein